MSYYRARINAYKELESKIKKTGNIGADPLLLIYELTLSYEVGENCIKKRLNLLKETGKIDDTGGVLVWKNEAETYQKGVSFAQKNPSFAQKNPSLTQKNMKKMGF